MPQVQELTWLHTWVEKTQVRLADQLDYSNFSEHCYMTIND